ncbi:hypothetical protein Sm713_54380 [Streptomyces sp. TS71-3]|nr:hypothetical protein Sm713_54380 [Streptomyces sp. TS71-3]
MLGAEHSFPPDELAEDVCRFVESAEGVGGAGLESQRGESQRVLGAQNADVVGEDILREGAASALS